MHSARTAFKNYQTSANGGVGLLILISQHGGKPNLSFRLEILILFIRQFWNCSCTANHASFALLLTKSDVACKLMIKSPRYICLYDVTHSWMELL